jgi:uncharacterized protein (TIGR00369 family)
MEYTLTKPQDISRMCFVCGEENALGLHAKFYETDQKELIGIFELRDHHQSYPGRVHGGVSAAILDELIGRALTIDEPDVWGVTIELSVKYRNPLPYDKPVVARGRITRNTSRVFEGTGEIVLEDGTIAAEATGRYIKLTLEQIKRGETAPIEDEMRGDMRPMPRTWEIADR